MKAEIKIAVYVFIFAVFTCLFLDISTYADKKKEHEESMKAIAELRQTLSQQRDKNEKQKILIERELENEKLKEDVYKQLRGEYE